MIAYRFKLYQSKKVRKLNSQLATCCDVFNHCIGLHRRFYRRFKKHLNHFRLQRHITKLKKMPQFHHWNSVNAQSLQEITDRIEKGYIAFFKHDNKRMPTFKCVDRYKSFTLKNSGWGLLGEHQIRIGSTAFKFFKSREIEGKVKIVTLKRNPVGDWFLFVVTDHEASDLKPKTGKTAGFDFGCTTFLTGSDGQSFESPLFFKQNRKIIVAASRSLSRKAKGSKNGRKALIDLARIHERVANQRNDWQWKLAKHLVEIYDTLCFETLDMKSMSKKHGKKVHDLGFADFMFKMGCLCTKHGKKLSQIDRWYPSSKTCSVCGHKHSELQEWERSWTCPQCKIVHDRDENAATNIHTVGTSTVSGEGVNLAFASVPQIR